MTAFSVLPAVHFQACVLALFERLQMETGGVAPQSTGDVFLPESPDTLYSVPVLDGSVQQQGRSCPLASPSPQGRNASLLTAASHQVPSADVLSIIPG